MTPIEIEARLRQIEADWRLWLDCRGQLVENVDWLVATVREQAQRIEELEILLERDPMLLEGQPIPPIPARLHQLRLRSAREEMRARAAEIPDNYWNRYGTVPYAPTIAYACAEIARLIGELPLDPREKSS